MNTHIETVNNRGGLTSAVVNPKYVVALREATKIERLAFTDAIKAFCDYEDADGNFSTAPERAYSNFTRSVYAKFGLNRKQIEARLNDENYGRDNFSALELLFVQSAERAVAQTLLLGINRGDLRKGIKLAVKKVVAVIHSSFEVIANGDFLKEAA